MKFKNILFYDLAKVFCWLGEHDWNRTTAGESDHIRLDGFHPTLLAIKGIQTGKIQCRRCKKFHRAYRTGLIGLGGPVSPSYSDPWTLCDEETQRNILEKPVIR